MFKELCSRTFYSSRTMVVYEFPEDGQNSAITSLTTALAFRDWTCAKAIPNSSFQSDETIQYLEVLIFESIQSKKSSGLTEI